MNQSNYIYYTNSKSNQEDNVIDADISSRFTRPLITNPSSYNVAVERFMIDVSTIPWLTKGLETGLELGLTWQPIKNQMLIQTLDRTRSVFEMILPPEMPTVPDAYLTITGNVTVRAKNDNSLTQINSSYNFR